MRFTNTSNLESAPRSPTVCRASEVWIMKLAIFGGTGYVGQALVRMAHRPRTRPAATGSESAQVRPSAVQPVEVVAGDALDIAAVRRTIAGCAAVLSTLGGYHGTPSLDEGTASVLAAMRASNIHRLVAMQGIPLPFPADPNNLGKHIVSAFLTYVARPLYGDRAPSGSCFRGPMTSTGP